MTITLVMCVFLGMKQPGILLAKKEQWLVQFEKRTEWVNANNCSIGGTYDRKNFNK